MDWVSLGMYQKSNGLLIPLSITELSQVIKEKAIHFPGIIFRGTTIEIRSYVIKSDLIVKENQWQEMPYFEFINCEFLGKVEIEGITTLHFQNCLFKEKFKIGGTRNKIHIEQCSFDALTDINPSGNGADCTIEKSLFIGTLTLAGDYNKNIWLKNNITKSSLLINNICSKRRNFYNWK